MILPGADAETALEVAERCRLALSRETIRLYSGHRITVTGSLGVGCLGTDADDVDGLIRFADRALYAAKDAGRDRVMTGSDLVPALAPVGSHRPGTPEVLPSLERVADLIDARLGDWEHSVAMARWAGVLADALGLDQATRDRVIRASRVHDIGKLAVSDSVLTKPGPLDEEEWALMRTHSEQGERVLMDAPGYRDVASIVRGHHERFDGTGYPDRIAGADLAVEIRMIGILDAWAAMRADRPYAAARTADSARAELLAARGTQFDPHIVDVFLALQAAGLIGHLNLVTHAVGPPSV
jgi:hypothetical protein